VAKVYSERFFTANGIAVETAYWVPSGKRAIVRSVVAANTQSEAGYWFFYVAGNPTYYRAYQALPQGDSVDMRVVAYGGQSIKVYTSAAALYVTVSGYLFEDPAMADAPEGDVSRTELDHATLLPGMA